MSNIFDELSTKIETEPLHSFFAEDVAQAMGKHFYGRDMHRGPHNSEELREPEKAYNVILKFMDKCNIKSMDDQDRSCYGKAAVSTYLAKACAEIPVETPEMAAKLIKTTSELFEMRRDLNNAQFQLDTFAKQGKYLGDKKVAEAYLDATSKSFSKLSGYEVNIGKPALEKYKSIVADHPEMAAKVLDTVSMLQDRFADADNSYLNESFNDILKAIQSTKDNDSKVILDRYFKSVDKYFHIEID